MLATLSARLVIAEQVLQHLPKILDTYISAVLPQTM